MSVLITGGSGFVGMNIAEYFFDKGLDVIIIDNKPLLPEFIRTLNRKKGNYQFVQVDILNQNEINMIFENYQISSIIHGAAISPSGNSDKFINKKVFEVNLLGTINLVEVGKQYEVNRMIYLSSASVYGDASFTNDLITEEIPPQPNTFYSISKYSGELTMQRYQKILDMDIKIVRLGAAFGRWEYNTGVRETLSAPFLSTLYALNGKQALLPRLGIKDWVYSRDIAEAIYRLMINKSLRHDIYNLGNQNIWSIKDWCEKLGDNFPDFSYNIVENELSNIPFYSDKDRASLSNCRINEDLNFENKYDLETSFLDYMNWINGLEDKKSIFNHLLLK